MQALANIIVDGNTNEFDGAFNNNAFQITYNNYVNGLLPLVATELINIDPQNTMIYISLMNLSPNLSSYQISHILQSIPMPQQYIYVIDRLVIILNFYFDAF